MILQILTHTPTWVFVIFLGLVYLGYSQSRGRLVSKPRLTVLPIFMLGLSLLGVWTAFGANRVGFVAWALAIVAAIGVNQVVRQPHGVIYLPDIQVFKIPGSWIPFVLMMMIFFTKYLVAVLLALDPARRNSAIFVAIASMAYGLSSGTFLARALLVMGVTLRKEPSLECKDV